MNYLIFWQQRAIAEYEAAALWYKEKSIQALENLEIAVNKQINNLRTHPTQYRKTYKEFREIQLEKYPFNIIYLVNEAKVEVIISSLYHHQRNPKRKYKNL